MSLKNRFFSILTVALGVVVFSTFTMAQDTTTPTIPDKASKRVRGERGERKMGDHGFGRHHFKRGFMKHGLRGIDLTDAQKAQIKTIREGNRPNAATIAELKTIREARKAGTAITPEQKERMKALREQSAAKAKSVHEQILAILTPEQKAQIEKRKGEMRQRFEQRRQNRKQRPAPTTTDKPVIK
jgi:periplasmic protein CpxP/Spy